MKARFLSFLVVAMTIFLFTGHTLCRAGDLEDRVGNSVEVLNEIMEIPENSIPYDLFDRCRAIAIFPYVVKAGFLVGGRFGRGILCVHNVEAGTWSPPAFFTIGGGSFGLQAGLESTDLVLLVMSKRAVEGLLGTQVTLGGDLGVAAGPVGRRLEAGTDLLFRGEFYSYSRNRGLFLGVSLEGATIFQDQVANQAFYGREIFAREILLDGKVEAPPAAQKLMDALNRYSAKQ